MTDRELLEAAAKAAGIEGEWEEHPDFEGRSTSGIYVPGRAMLWNPLIDDGDALRLAVKLSIGVMSAHYTGRTCAYHYCEGRDGGFFEEHRDDAEAATRRAVVRAAAAMGAA